MLGRVRTLAMTETWNKLMKVNEELTVRQCVGTTLVSVNNRTCDEPVPDAYN